MVVKEGEARHNVTVLHERGAWGEGSVELMREVAERVLSVKVVRSWGGKEVRVGVDVSLSDDERMRSINKRWRERDRATDVLSFPQYEGEALGGLLVDGGGGGVSEEVVAMLEGGYDVMLGDVMLSWETLLLEAMDLGVSWQERGCEVLVHGILHLWGYDHERGERDAREMEGEEDRLRGEWISLVKELE